MSGCIEDTGLHWAAPLLGRPLYYFISKPEYWPRYQVVINAEQLSPSASAASGPAALTFVWGEEPVGPGGNLLSVEQIKDCTPAQVKPRRPDLQVVGEPCAVAYGTAAGLKGCPHWTVGLLDLGNKVMFANSLYLGWGMKFTDLKVVRCFEISISPENL